MLRELCYPFDAAEIMQKRKKLLRTLKEQTGGVKLRIAVLGGSTTSDIIKMLELFLRNRGIEPEFYESEYAQYWQDAMFPNAELEAFKPELIFLAQCAGLPWCDRFQGALRAQARAGVFTLRADVGAAGAGICLPDHPE